MYSESFSKKLNYKLRELEIIIKQLDSDNNRSLIDLDLALEKTRELYEILLNLGIQHDQDKYVNTPMQPKGKPVISPDPETTEDDNIFQADEVIPDPFRKRSDKFRDIHGNQPEKVDPSKQDKDPAIEIPLQQDEEDMEDLTEKDSDKGKNEKMKKKHNGTQEVEIVADKFMASQNYINQAMANKQKRNDITSRSQSKPLSDLKSSIGLNDKFLFIKELFNGRPEKYNQCLDDLNESPSFEEALEYIKNNYNWDENNEVAEKLINLVRRRHLPE